MQSNLLFFDLDGTLCPNDQLALPQATIDIFPRLIANHNIPIITTGRSYYEVAAPLLKKLNVDSYILSNGCYGVLNGRVIFNHQVPTSMIETVLADADRFKYDVGFFNQHGFAISGLNHTTEHHCQHMRIADPLIDRDYYLTHPVNFMNAYIDQSHQAELTHRLGPSIAVIRYAPLAVDILPVGITKGPAIQEFIKAAGVDVNQTFAFGDQQNDVSMFQTVDVGVAMANATDELKALAAFVATEDNGVLEGLNHFNLI